MTITTRGPGATRATSTRRRLRRLVIAVALAALLLVLTAGAAFAPTAVEYAVMLG